MDEKAVNEYMSKLIQAQGKGLTGLEQEAFTRFMTLNEEARKGEGNLQRMEQEIERLKVTLQRSMGQREAFVQLLVAAEAARRLNSSTKKNDLPPGPVLGEMTEEELKEKLGADRIEEVGPDLKPLPSRQ